MFFFFFFTQPELSNEKTTEIQMKNIMYLPQSGDGIYEELAEIFSKEKRFNDGFNEASAIVKALCAVPDYPFDLNVLVKKTRYQIVSLPLLWVLLKLQPDIEEMKKYIRDLEYTLSGVPKAATYLKRCEESIDDWITKRWDAQKKWLSSPTTVGSSLLLQMPEIIEKQQDLLERITLLEKDNAEKVLQLKQCDKDKKRLNILFSVAEKKLAENEKKMASKEFRDEVGKEYLLRMFKGYLKNAKKWSQRKRDKEYDGLEHLLKLEGLPQDVKDMIEALAEDKGDERIVNVHGPYNDIHDNGNVDIK